VCVRRDKTPTTRVLFLRISFCEVGCGGICDDLDSGLLVPVCESRCMRKYLGSCQIDGDIAM
jgi:hypothetical protein